MPAECCSYRSPSDAQRCRQRAGLRSSHTCRLSLVHVATPVPSRYLSMVQMPAPNASAAATSDQSFGVAEDAGPGLILKGRQDGVVEDPGVRLHGDQPEPTSSSASGLRMSRWPAIAVMRCGNSFWTSPQIGSGRRGTTGHRPGDRVRWPATTPRPEPGVDDQPHQGPGSRAPLTSSTSWSSSSPVRSSTASTACPSRPSDSRPDARSVAATGGPGAYADWLPIDLSVMRLLPCDRHP